MEDIDHHGSDPSSDEEELTVASTATLRMLDGKKSAITPSPTLLKTKPKRREPRIPRIPDINRILDLKEVEYDEKKDSKPRLVAFLEQANKRIASLQQIASKLHKVCTSMVDNAPNAKDAAKDVREAVKEAKSTAIINAQTQFQKKLLAATEKHAAKVLEYKTKLSTLEAEHRSLKKELKEAQADSRKYKAELEKLSKHHDELNRKCVQLQYANEMLKENQKMLNRQVHTNIIMQKENLKAEQKEKERHLKKEQKKENFNAAMGILQSRDGRHNIDRSTGKYNYSPDSYDSRRRSRGSSRRYRSRSRSRSRSHSPDRYSRSYRSRSRSPDRRSSSYRGRRRSPSRSPDYHHRGRSSRSCEPAYQSWDSRSYEGPPMDAGTMKPHPAAEAAVQQAHVQSFLKDEDSNFPPTEPMEENDAAHALSALSAISALTEETNGPRHD